MPYSVPGLKQTHQTHQTHIEQGFRLEQAGEDHKVSLWRVRKV